MWQWQDAHKTHKINRKLTIMMSALPDFFVSIFISEEFFN